MTSKQLYYCRTLIQFFEYILYPRARGLGRVPTVLVSWLNPGNNVLPVFDIPSLAGDQHGILQECTKLHASGAAVVDYSAFCSVTTNVVYSGVRFCIPGHFPGRDAFIEFYKPNLSEAAELFRYTTLLSWRDAVYREVEDYEKTLRYRPGEIIENR